MARRPGKRATYQDLEALPDNVVGELIDGELIVSPRPFSPHSVAEISIAADLDSGFSRSDRGGPGGWWILMEPEIHLHGDVLVPDLAGWRRTRMDKPPRDKHIELPADWVCEIASPSTARVDRSRKMPVYAREGIEWVWIVDPIARSLEVFKRTTRLYEMVSAWGDNALDKIRAEPFDAIELELARWWLPGE